MNRIVIIFIGAFLLFSVYSLGTAKDSPYVRDGKEYGVTQGNFRGKWWNYYERGISFAEGGFWKEAEADFGEALEKRQEDNRRSRTYGLHFVEYFGHREQGIVYYHQGRMEEAETEITKSLAQEESARAKFYLNKVRESILKRAGNDTSPPEIFVDSSGMDGLTQALEIEVKGSAVDDKYVSEIQVNGQPVFIEMAEKKLGFSKKVRLKPGQNEIVATATDLMGKTAFKKIPVTVDRQAPLMSIDSITRQADNRYTIEGLITDQTGVAELKIGGEKVLLTGKTEALFSHTVSGSEGSEAPFNAVDSAGNSTQGTVVLETMAATRHGNTQTVAARVKGPLLYAALAANTVADASSPAAYGPLLVAQAEGQDTKPPFIKLEKGIEKKQSIFLDSFFIEGLVKDAGEVVSLTINDEPVLTRSGVKLYFNYLAELKEGENIFTLAAQDAAGNSSTMEIVVERKVPEVKRISSRLAMALLPFEKKGDVATLATAVDDSFMGALSHRERFNIVARAKDLEAILAEQKLSSSDLADKSAAIRLGKIVSAEVIIGGSVNETQKYLQVCANILDTETSEVFFSTDVYGEDKDMESFEYLMGGLAWKVSKNFPMVEAQVVKVEGENITVDCGEDKKIRKNMRFFLYPSLKEGAVSTDILGKVTHVGASSSKLEMVKKAKPVEVNYLAITK